MTDRKTLDETLNDVTPLAQLLGEERTEKLKDRIADVIVKRVEQDLSDYGYYLFWPPDYESIVDETFEKTNKKIKKMYSDAILENVEKFVSQLKEVTENYIKEINTSAKSCESDKE